VMNLRMTILIMSALENMNALEHLHQGHFHGQSGNWRLHVTLVPDPSTQLCTGITVGDVAILTAMFTRVTVTDCLI